MIDLDGVLDNYTIYTEEIPSIKKGAKEFLDFCKKNEIKLGIATSNSKELVEATLEALQIREYFDCVMTACEVAKGKPAPDIYLAVADKIEKNPAECLRLKLLCIVDLIWSSAFVNPQSSTIILTCSRGKVLLTSITVAAPIEIP